MTDLENIKNKSYSRDEIVLEYDDAIKLLNYCELSNIKILGWEGWIKYSDGSIGHSQKYQGTNDLFDINISDAIALSKNTINLAHSEWKTKPEIENATLLFCFTTDT